MMEEILQCWLASQHRLALPGLGTLQMDTAAVELDFINKRITPPVQQIIFAEGSIKADKNFYQYLANSLHTDETNAIIQFTNFVTELTNKLYQDGTTALKGIGEFTNDKDNRASFQPYQFAFESYSILSAEKILRHQESFDVLQGDMANNSTNAAWELEQGSNEQIEDKWWVGALILFAVGAIAILFYFLT